MLPFFPQPQPDELLYSVLARYSLARGTIAQKRLMEEVFGRQLAIATMDLPNGLQFLADQLPNTDAFSVNTLLLDHTLFPYYVAFQSKEMRDLVGSTLAGSRGVAHSILGLTVFQARGPNVLQFCRHCLEEMEDSLKFVYWKRVHQLPGVLVCPEHRSRLRASTVNMHVVGRHRYVAASAETCPEGASPITPPLSPLLRARAVEIAQASLRQLGALGEPRSTEEWEEWYRKELYATGFVRGRLQIDQIKLRDHIRFFLGDLVDRIAGLEFSNDQSPNWLKSIARTRGRARQPIQHIILGLFLADQPRVTPPFGRGPWECRNPLADHKGELVADLVFVGGQRGRQYGQFACKCGYEYTIGIEPDGTLGRPAFRKYGPLLAPKLRAMMAAGCTIGGMARVLSISPKTLLRQASLVGVRLRDDQPMAISTEVTKRPKKRRASGGPNRTRHLRLSWSEIDAAYAASLRQAACEVLEVEPPLRITLRQLEGRLGRRDWLIKRRRKLPVSSAAASAVAESVCSFQERRAVWWVRRCFAEGVVDPWIVVRRGGLPKEMSAFVRTEIDRHRRHA